MSRAAGTRATPRLNTTPVVTPPSPGSGGNVAVCDTRTLGRQSGRWPTTNRDHDPCPARRERSAAMCLDRYIRVEVYKSHGISVLDHCRAEPPRDSESARLGGAFGGRYRGAAAAAAALGLQTPAGVARGRFRGVACRCAAAPLPDPARAAHAGRRLARSVSPLLVGPGRRAGAPPRSHEPGTTPEGKETMSSRENYRPGP